MSLTAHPDRDELIMFGGEYFTGSKVSPTNSVVADISTSINPFFTCLHVLTHLQQTTFENVVANGEISHHIAIMFYTLSLFNNDSFIDRDYQ